MSKVIDTKELDKLASKLAGAAMITERNMSDAVMRFAFLIQTEAATKISKGRRSGNEYKRGRKTHRASAGGEPPKTDTGRLVASIRPISTGFLSAEVGSLDAIAPYGGMLEDGTKNMDARPWLEPTLKENQDELGKYITAAIRTGGLAS